MLLASFQLSRKKKILLVTSISVLLIVLTYSLNRPEKMLSEGDVALANSNYKLAFEKYSLTTKMYPFNSSAHQRLSRLYSLINNWEKAKEEINLALDLTSDKDSLKKELQEIENTIDLPQKIKEEIAYWEKIVSTKPDYRDAWIQISIRYYQLYDTPKAREALVKAKEIDPNNETTAKLEELYSKN